MPMRRTSWLGTVAVTIELMGIAYPAATGAQTLEPIVYTVRVPKPGLSRCRDRGGVSDGGAAGR